MGRAERRKGVVGEREVRQLYEAAGFTLRGLEGAGDFLALQLPRVHHVEAKRQEVARPWLWQEQALAEAPEGTLPVVAFRRSRSIWWAMSPLEAWLAELHDARSAGR